MSSGGVDSSLTMMLLKNDGHEIFPAHVDYGHLAESREWKACQVICSQLGVHDPVRFRIGGTEVIPSSLVHYELNRHDQAFFPTRNLLFATLGASYAHGISCNVIALGILANPVFPDQRPEFFKSAEVAISQALGKEMRISTPLISLDKREVLKLARAKKLPLELAYYCHTGGDQPCGTCIACRDRIAAESKLSEESL